jgi:hypothetical protein
LRAASVFILVGRRGESFDGPAADILGGGIERPPGDGDGTAARHQQLRRFQSEIVLAAAHRVFQHRLPFRGRCVSRQEFEAADAQVEVAGFQRLGTERRAIHAEVEKLLEGGGANFLESIAERLHVNGRHGRGEVPLFRQTMQPFQPDPTDDTGATRFAGHAEENAEGKLPKLCFGIGAGDGLTLVGRLAERRKLAGVALRVCRPSLVPARLFLADAVAAEQHGVRSQPGAAMN